MKYVMWSNYFLWNKLKASGHTPTLWRINPHNAKRFAYNIAVEGSEKYFQSTEINTKIYRFSKLGKREGVVWGGVGRRLRFLEILVCACRCFVFGEIGRENCCANGVGFSSPFSTEKSSQSNLIKVMDGCCERFAIFKSRIDHLQLRFVAFPERSRAKRQKRFLSGKLALLFPSIILFFHAFFLFYFHSFHVISESTRILEASYRFI